MQMQAVAKLQAGPGADLIRTDVPTPGFGEVLVRVKAASICGTDVHIYTWDPWARTRIQPPLIFGHEFAGEVVEVGPGVQRAKPGDYVSAECHIVCNACTPCRTGNRHVCQDYRIFGVDLNGCFAEYLTVPESNLWWNPISWDPAIAALQDPLGNAVHTVLSGPITGKTVLICGCGPIGILAAGVAKAAGAALVIASDFNAYRLGLAQRMGADIAIDLHESNLVEVVMRETRGQGVEVVLEMSGSPEAIHDGLSVLQNAGRLSLLGIPSQPVVLDLASEVVFKGVTVQGITGRRMFETWHTVQGLLDSGRLDVRPVLTHSFALHEFESAMQTMLSGQSGKITLIP